ncbi:hypothetical protein [Bacillus chungangensis]|uniref:STAS/SEC14 domain-containing protein n=1 Tax=Bacillus chungangensis TaxID=587633 RepID=A0ABT9WWR7_9BACI|nr:hypothetical protein [Bacillus chungangensis]MDQ0177748.1 hypothetical protein [Bacillus chungangensis]
MIEQKLIDKGEKKCSKYEENASIFKLENTDGFSFINSLEEILKEKQPFELIMVREIEKADKQKEKEVRLAIAKWLKSNKHLISKYYVGFAMVVLNEEEFQKSQPTASKLTTVIYGCPGDMFNTEEEALIWVHHQLRK